MAETDSQALARRERADGLLEQPLPHAAASERLILGMMMLSERVAEEAGLTLTAEDFYLRSHQHTFLACLAVAARGDEPNSVLVCEELRRIGVLEAAGGVPAVAGLTAGLPFTTTISPHARLLREKRALRRLRQVCEHASTAAQEGEQEAEAIVERLEADLRELGARQDALARPRTVGERCGEDAARYDLLFHGATDALATGFAELDTRLTGGGLRPKQLVIVAARPSAGKSSLMLDIAAHVSAAGRNVLIFSLEMGAEQLVDRLVSFESGVERWKIRGGVYESDYLRLRDSLPRVGELPLWVDDRNRSLSRLLHFSRDLARRPETRPALICVDYIQLVESDGHRSQRSRNEEIGAVSRALKGLANELGVPVLALSQLSRDCEKQGREPELADLRDSGEIENDADIVLFLFGERAREGSEFYTRNVKCAKHREGPLFRAELLFCGPFVSFRRRDGAPCEVTQQGQHQSGGFVPPFEIMEEGEPQFVDFPDPYPSSSNGGGD